MTPPSTSTLTTDTSGLLTRDRDDHTGFTRSLRPRGKVLPEHARTHNRSLVLQTLYRTGAMSRADVARATGLTRVTVSDLVAELIADAIVLERGPSESVRPGKPATIIDIDRTGFHILALDLSESTVLRGALLSLDGDVQLRHETPLDGLTGDAACRAVLDLARRLLADASRPILGIGVGSPGIVDADGRVLSAPNLGWSELPLRAILERELGHPVTVVNDANAAVLAEYSFGDADGDLMIVKVGHGVGAGVLLGGSLVLGRNWASGEIGHVTVGTDGGLECVCGKRACLETWLAVPRLEAQLAAVAGSGDASESARDAVLREAGERLGIALAPVVGTLGLTDIALAGPPALLDGVLADAVSDTIRARTMERLSGDLSLRMTSLGDDIVLLGAAVLVLSGRLGVS
jgi:predicted NBD/HSP70 family sugar kinase